MILTFALVFALGATGCTSKRTEGDEADVEASTDDGLETADATENNSDLDVADSGGGGGDAAMGDELSPAEQLPDAGGGDMVADNGAPPADVAPGDISETPPADAPPAEMMADQATPTGDVPPAMTADAPTQDLSTPTPEPSAPAAAPVSMDLKKIASQPYRVGKTLVNAVYLARKGDSPESISQKVFGTNSRVKELCKVNAYNCSRSVKVGDKFYYNSPQRPTDDTTVKTFYEDAGVAPETYVAKGGDNIRKVGKQLLGDQRSWMELWATNSVDSKGALDEGAQLKYWPNSDVAAPALAKAEAGPSEVATTDGGAGDGMDAAVPPPPPPGMDLAANAPPPPDAGGMPPDMGQPPPPPPSDLPPPPPGDPNQAAAAAPGAIDAPPPPPPPPPTEAPHAGGDVAAEGSDPNQTMALGVGAVLLLAAAFLFISIRKKRQRRSIDYTATQTQIDG